MLLCYQYGNCGLNRWLIRSGNSIQQHQSTCQKENLTVLPPQTIPLRIVIHADPKLNATILDAEIGGRYTMASMRTDLQIRSVRIRQGASGQSRLRPVRNGTRSSEQ